MTLMARWFVVTSTMLVVIALSGVQAICKDSINDCADYEEGTCKTYPVWAKTYCKSRCNLCIIEKATCEDAITHCNEYNDAFCQDYPLWANTTCAKRCGICQKEDICEDVQSNCDEFDNDMCTLNPMWAEQNCAGKCKLCKDICEDVQSNCDEFDNDMCTLYPMWAEQNCAGKCKLCKECADGWTRYEADKTCIKVFGTSSMIKTWENARNSCISLGGDLVIIKDNKKNDFVFGLLGNYYSHWIGMENVLETKEKEFDFRYVDGSKMGDFHPWLPETPDNYHGREKCVTISKKQGYNKQWNDAFCGMTFPYVCSISLV